MSEQPYLFAPDADALWIEIRDGDPTAMSIFKRHYTARKVRLIEQFIGPGEKYALITPDARALFAWRKFFSDAGETGVNCCVFRNEGTELAKSSELIRQAMKLAWNRWPGERLYTYVDPRGVRHKRDPGRCFIKAGFRKCGVTKAGKLIFEALPPEAADTTHLPVVIVQVKAPVPNRAAKTDRQNPVPTIEPQYALIGFHHGKPTSP